MKEKTQGSSIVVAVADTAAVYYFILSYNIHQFSFRLLWWHVMQYSLLIFFFMRRNHAF
jgi:hypothetical protein